MTISRLSALAILLLWRSASYAEDSIEKKATCEAKQKEEAKLCSYEPNTVGYTKDSDDVGFLDFTLSVRYQLMPDTIRTWLGNH